MRVVFNWEKKKSYYYNFSKSSFVLHKIVFPIKIYLHYNSKFISQATLHYGLILKSKKVTIIF